jgi:hypothetical protein
VISLYIIYQAAQLRMPRYKLLKMGANVAVELIGGSVPILGDRFDVTLKANPPNLQIIEDHVRPVRSAFA